MIKNAKPGDVFTRTHWSDGTIAPMSHPQTVVSNKNRNCKNGQWVCLTHGMVFDNNIQQENHCQDELKNDHKLAWRCTEHGEVEEP